MFFMCSYPGGRHVEDIRGRGGGAGIDHAVRRDDRGLGAGDSPALKLSVARGTSLEPHPGEKLDDRRKSPVRRGLRGAKASPLRGESAFEGHERPSSPVIASP